MADGDTTFEEARRCPKCQQPGQDRKSEPLLGTGGKTLHHVYCENERCEWYNTPWLVQVNADGSVPPPQDHRASRKEFLGFEFHDEEAKRVVDNLQRQVDLQTRPGGHNEIRNPHA